MFKSAPPQTIKEHVRLLFHRPDCVQILKKCHNASAQLASVSAEEVCNELSPPEDQAHCISLEEYLGIVLSR